MLTQPTIKATEALQRLNADGYVVLENLLPKPTVSFLRDRVEGILAYEREHPVDPGESTITNDQVDDVDFEYWRSDADEVERMKRRIRHRQAEEFDTPWPVRADEVCISFIHIPTLFDDGRSQRIFNLINKDTAFAPLVEHPLLLEMMDQELGRDSIVLDMSVNHVGPHTNSAGWHVDSPLTQIARAAAQLHLEHPVGLDARRLHDRQRRHARRARQPSHAAQTTIGARLAGERDRARRPGGVGGGVAVADVASSRRQRHRRRAQRRDHPVRALLGEAVRRSAHTDDCRAGRRLLTAIAVHVGLQRQRSSPRLKQTAARSRHDHRSLSCTKRPAVRQILGRDPPISG